MKLVQLFVDLSYVTGPNLSGVKCPGNNGLALAVTSNKILFAVALTFAFLKAVRCRL